MDTDFEQIIQLQNLDTEIRSAELVLEGIPRLTEEIDRKIQACSKVVADAKDKLAQNQKKRRDLETEVKDIKVQIGKYKRQLNEVKTNKEYTVLLKEIEEAQHAIDTFEEAIIAEMLAADDIEEEIQAALRKQAREEESLTKEKLVLNEKMKETEARKAKLQREREDLLPGIPPDQRRLYETIYQKKGGIALSPVRGDFCAMCHMRIRPQMLNEIRDKAVMILCENCGRILYWPTKAEAAKAESAKLD